VIPERVERKARWVLDTLGAGHVRLGEELRYDADAWGDVERGKRPARDELAQAFFDLARLEEIGAPRDEHGRFTTASSLVDPLDPPLERLRRRLGAEPPRLFGARFAVGLSHDVDIPWRWTAIGVRGAAARLKGHMLAREPRRALREARALAAVPAHKARRTDPNWRFREIVGEERSLGAASTFYVLGAHRHPADGAAPQTYERLRPRVVETLLGYGAEVGLHGSYTAADNPVQLGREYEHLKRLAGTVAVRGHRYHYLRVDPHRNLAVLAEQGLGHDSSLGFGDAVGFRAGIAYPFQPWDVRADEPLDLVEVPLAVMDATLAEERYSGLSARQGEPVVMRLLDWAAEHGGGFSILWHPDRFDPWTAAGWDRLYFRVVEAVRDRGGVCVSVAALADEWLALSASAKAP
jgi:hypothetical protein